MRADPLLGLDVHPAPVFNDSHVANIFLYLLTVENVVANRRNRFINRYGETDDYLCQMLR